ncbi:Uu.00g043850.m01.CDS01 [Anthostomella pinea]|uniref:Uu.00g043850.m01.CDS01 n=1 Tax=Anthostomella pinea TaxID=933095 RepID=A0AAI8VBC7_9PEZI|nr:Uu.00g043850.m01.CDS01 [Anthostomella pinea]
MPVGIQRINAKKSQPNDRIIFIKPLKGPDEAIAQDFLERIAAQCLPIMREHHLSIMTLEEYEPNREFVGRNFNAGEVVQLVLKSPSTGRWLPFNYVQMVMMHELAHCKQMNHSKAFWAVRNGYADQIRILWTRSYTGEGLWGRGALLETGQFEANTVHADEVLPEHLCGGTYRSRRRKRKAKQQLSYQERKERRILKKFGANGVSLGDDEDVKAELEKGRRTQAKPRVAGSKRGRELRAAAALARFGQQKEVEDFNKPIDIDEDDETASDSGSDVTGDGEDEGESTIDINGQKLLDDKGNNLIKVCEDENPEDGDAQNELRELSSASGIKRQEQGSTTKAKSKAKEKTKEAQRPDTTPKPNINIQKLVSGKPKGDTGIASLRTAPKGDEYTASLRTAEVSKAAATGDCHMCSFQNERDSTICSVCSHVLDADKVPGSWSCYSKSCQGSLYLNAGDSGICGLCGERKGPGT